ncbi:MAG: hypothetical protein K8Q99_04020 [Acholeplasmataceae bacterium]|nr:hypothetical protein [Acholeplasmataceae bacterium]
MNFILNRDDFSIMFCDIGFYEKDINMDAPISGTIRVSIKSDKYAAKSYLDLYHKDFIRFLNDIVNLWKSLKTGKAIIKEPYGYEQFVEFISGNGKFTIKGKLVDQDFQKFKIEFEEVVDQSDMNDFIKDIGKFDLENYLK